MALEVIGGIASIIQLAGTVYTISKTLYEVGEALSNAPSDIKDLARDLETFSDELHLLSTLLHGKDGRYADQVYRLTAKIIGDCATICTKIDRNIRKLRSGSVLAKIKWLYKEKEIMKLLARLRDLKLSLMGTLSVLSALRADNMMDSLGISNPSLIGSPNRHGLSTETRMQVEDTRLKLAGMSMKHTTGASLGSKPMLPSSASSISGSSSSTLSTSATSATYGGPPSTRMPSTTSFSASSFISTAVMPNNMPPILNTEANQSVDSFHSALSYQNQDSQDPERQQGLAPTDSSHALSSSSSSLPQVTPLQETRYPISGACHECRRKNRKCDGKSPCDQCTSQSGSGDVIVTMPQLNATHVMPTSQSDQFVANNTRLGNDNDHGPIGKDSGSSYGNVKPTDERMKQVKSFLKPEDPSHDLVIPNSVTASYGHDKLPLSSSENSHQVVTSESKPLKSWRNDMTLSAMKHFNMNITDAEEWANKLPIPSSLSATTKPISQAETCPAQKLKTSLSFWRMTESKRTGRNAHRLRLSEHSKSRIAGLDDDAMRRLENRRAQKQSWEKAEQGQKRDSEGRAHSGQATHTANRDEQQNSYQQLLENPRQRQLVVIERENKERLALTRQEQWIESSMLPTNSVAPNPQSETSIAEDISWGGNKSANLSHSPHSASTLYGIDTQLRPVDLGFAQSEHFGQLNNPSCTTPGVVPQVNQNYTAVQTWPLHGTSQQNQKPQSFTQHTQQIQMQQQQQQLQSQQQRQQQQMARLSPHRSLEIIDENTGVNVEQWHNFDKCLSMEMLDNMPSGLYELETGDLLPKLQPQEIHMQSQASQEAYKRDGHPSHPSISPCGKSEPLRRMDLPPDSIDDISEQAFKSSKSDTSNKISNFYFQNEVFKKGLGGFWFRGLINVKSFDAVIWSNLQQYLNRECVYTTSEEGSNPLVANLDWSASLHKERIALRLQMFPHAASSIQKILDVLVVMEETIGLKIGAIAWACLLGAVENLLSHDTNWTVGSKIRIITEMSEIVSIVARYTVMENIYAQWKGMSLDKEYEQSLINLSTHVLIYLGAFVPCLSESSANTDMKPYFDKIIEADTACRGFKVIVSAENTAIDRKRSFEDFSDDSDHTDDSDGTILGVDGDDQVNKMLLSAKRIKI
ncbi:hypothetical protein EAE96_008804 [Botrytis aclada]|nr:hypothetical protein EAE96_008804 [Botrytis aclada]